MSRQKKCHFAKHMKCPFMSREARFSGQESRLAWSWDDFTSPARSVQPWAPRPPVRSFPPPGRSVPAACPGQLPERSRRGSGLRSAPSPQGTCHGYSTPHTLPSVDTHLAGRALTQLTHRRAPRACPQGHVLPLDCFPSHSTRKDAEENRYGVL